MGYQGSNISSRLQVRSRMRRRHLCWSVQCRLWVRTWRSTPLILIPLWKVTCRFLRRNYRRIRVSVVCRRKTVKSEIYRPLLRIRIRNPFPSLLMLLLPLYPPSLPLQRSYHLVPTSSMHTQWRGYPLALQSRCPLH